MKILAIDPAEKTGWATNTGAKGKFLWGTWDFKLRRDESFGMKLIRFKSKILEIVKTEKIDLIFFERPSGFRAAAVMSHSKFVGVIELIGIELEIPTKGYSAKEIKKFATNNGNAGKKLMIQAAIKKLGYRGGNDNEADALWILEFAKNDLGL
jgi:Holliday junction resolvasome RuvABC endonuclease subunit